MTKSHEAGLAVKSELESLSSESCTGIERGDGEALQVAFEAAMSGWLAGTVKELDEARRLEEMVKVLLRRVLGLGVILLGAGLLPMAPIAASRASR